MDERIKYLKRLVTYGRGDDLHRARAAFAGLSKQQMQEQYGHSGQTRQAILDGYEASDELHTLAEAIFFERFPEALREG